MITLKTVWESFLLALTRFLDNRFVKKPNQALLILEREIEKRDKIIEYLQEAMINLNVQEPKAQEEPVIQEFKPIVHKNWRSHAAELEKAAREKKAQMSSSVDDLEKELGVVDGLR